MEIDHDLKNDGRSRAIVTSLILIDHILGHGVVPEKPFVFWGLAILTPVRPHFYHSEIFAFWDSGKRSGGNHRWKEIDSVANPNSNNNPHTLDSGIEGGYLVVDIQEDRIGGSMDGEQGTRQEAADDKAHRSLDT